MDEYVAIIQCNGDCISNPECTNEMIGYTQFLYLYERSWKRSLNFHIDIEI